MGYAAPDWKVTLHSSATETCSSSSRGAGHSRRGLAGTMRLRLWKDTSSILQFGLCWAAVSARCCVPRVAPCQVSRSWLCRSLPLSRFDSDLFRVLLLRRLRLPLPSVFSLLPVWPSSRLPWPSPRKLLEGRGAWEICSCPGVPRSRSTSLNERLPA